MKSYFLIGKIHYGFERILPFLFFFAVLLEFAQADVLTSINRRIEALRMAYSPAPASGDVVLVAVDKRSLNAVGAWPWPRSVHGEMIDRLRAAGARDIFLDFDFSYATTPVEDDALRGALERAGGGVLLPIFGQNDAMDNDGTDPVDINRPFAPFDDLSWPAAVTVPADSDGVIRRYFYSLALPDGPADSIAALLTGQQGPPDATFAINFSIQPRSIPVYSARDVADGTVDPTAFQNKSVIVGASALELRDNFNVPVHGILPGAMVHALATETLRTGTIPKAMDPAWVVGWSVLLVALMNLWHRRLRAWGGVTLVIGSCLLTEAISLFLYRVDQLQTATGIFYVGVLCYGFWRLSVSLELLNWRLSDKVARLDNATELLQRIFENSEAWIVVVDDRGKILAFSDSARKNFADGTDALTLPPVFAEIARSVIANGTARHGPGGTQVTLDNRIFKCTATLSKLHRAAVGKSRRSTDRTMVTLTITDVTDTLRQQQRIARLSTFDAQSGAVRRHVFENTLADALCIDRPATVFAIQVAGLAKVNTILGPDIADAFLKAIVIQLDHVFSPGAAVARLSDQVFAVMAFAPSTPEESDALAQDLLAMLSQPIQVRTASINARPQIGFAFLPKAVASDAHDLLRQAEIALDAVLQTNDAVMMPFKPALAARRTRLAQVEDALWGAHLRGECHLLYQPQVDIDTGQIVGFEALLRWTHPVLGSIPPDLFIPIAESNGYIHDLGRWVLLKACQDAQRLPDDITVAVNVSGHQLHGDTFEDEVRHTLQTTGLQPGRLCLELTESVFVEMTDKIVDQMCAIAAMGPFWALDDFGTGYSSFAYLSRLPLKKIKLDKSFAQSPDNDPHTDAILRSVAVLCDGINAVLLCEGVETRSQLDRIRGARCRLVQGYYYGKPQSLNEIQRSLSVPLSA